MFARLRRRMRHIIRRWARRRYGVDREPLTLPGNRIYILPTGLGVAFALMIFAMFLGAMNYANNLALGLAFMLGALGLTAMHYCHRNLAGVRIHAAGAEPVFAGGAARFRIVVENPARLARHELSVANDHGATAPVRIDPAQRAVLELDLPAKRRGLLTLEHFEIETRHPFGLFRAWAHVHLNAACIVYPRPSERGAHPPAIETDTGAAQDLARGGEDFAGLRAFHAGDSPRHIAWKAYARGQTLQVKVYAGTAVASHLFDWDALPGLAVEARLSRLCRWVEDAYASDQAYGLKIPGLHIPPGIGRAHRRRCLTALALFDERGA